MCKWIPCSLRLRSSVRVAISNVITQCVVFTVIINPLTWLIYLSLCSRHWSGLGLMRTRGSCNVVRLRPGDVPTSYQPVIIIKNKFFIFCFILIDDPVTVDRQTAQINCFIPILGMSDFLLDMSRGRNDQDLLMNLILLAFLYKLDSTLPLTNGSLVGLRGSVILYFSQVKRIPRI